MVSLRRLLEHGLLPRVLGLEKDIDLLYTKTGRTAPWRLRPRTEYEYLMTHAHHLPLFVQIPGWSLYIHRYDLMHVIYLGRGTANSQLKIWFVLV